MKFVIIDHPDWIRLMQEDKVAPVLDAGKCACALHNHPATKHWKPALIFFTAVVPLGVITGIGLIFIKWWIGLVVIFITLGLLQTSISWWVKREVLRVAKNNTSFFSCAIATGGLRFLVKEEDLQGIEYMDGSLDVPYFMPKFD